MLHLSPNTDLMRDANNPQFLAAALSPEIAKSCLSIGLTVAVGRVDKRGNFHVEKRVPAHSIVTAFPRMLNFSLSLNTQGEASVVDINGGTDFSVASGPYMRVDGTANISSTTSGTSKGIFCGTGTNAVTMADTALQTPIANGSGAGQLTWGAVQFVAVGSSGNNRLITFTTAFTNSSGNAINVTEVALYCRDNASRSFCLCRDLLSFTINNGATKTVQYQFTVALT